MGKASRDLSGKEIRQRCKTTTRIPCSRVLKHARPTITVRALIEVSSRKYVSLRLLSYVEPSTFHDENPISSSLVGQSADSCKTIHAFWLRLKTMRGGAKRIMANYNLLSDKLHHYFNRRNPFASLSVC